MFATPFYRDSDAIFEAIGPQETFAAFVRALLTYLLDCDASWPKRSANDEDRAFFNAVDSFLLDEGQVPLALPPDASVPEELADALHWLLGGLALNAKPHVFNTGADAQDRGRSPIRQQRLASLFSAASDLYEARHPNREANPQLKLWKKEVEVRDGQIVSSAVHEVDEIDFRDNVILCLPGLSCIHSRKTMHESGIRNAELMLGGDSLYTHPKDGKRYSIYTVSYPYQNRMAFAAEMHLSNAQSTTYTHPRVQAFVNDVLFPSMGIQHGGSNKTLGELKSAFRHLSILSNSYGSIVAQQMRNATANRLKELGYSVDMVKQAMPMIYHQSVIPVASLETTVPADGSFSNFYLCPAKDLTAQSRTDYHRFVTDVNAEKQQKINDHTLMLWTQSPPTGINFSAAMDEYYSPMTPEERYQQWQVPAPGYNPGHYPTLGMHDVMDSQGRLYSNTSSRYALRNAVSREGEAFNWRTLFKPKELARRWMDAVRAGRGETLREPEL